MLTWDRAAWYSRRDKRKTRRKRGTRPGVTAQIDTRRVSRNSIRCREPVWSQPSLALAVAPAAVVGHDRVSPAVCAAALVGPLASAP